MIAVDNMSDHRSKIAALVKEAVNGKEKINNLVYLIDHLEANNPSTSALAANGFVLVFKHYQTDFNFQLRSEAVSDGNSSEEKVACWLYDQYKEFVKKLKDCLLNGESSCELLAELVEIMRFVSTRLFVEQRGALGREDVEEMNVICSTVLKNDVQSPIWIKLAEYLKHTDFTTQFLKALPVNFSGSQADPKEQLKIFHILSMICDHVPEKKQKEGSFLLCFDQKITLSPEKVDKSFVKRYNKTWTTANLRKRFGLAWLEFLKNRLPTSLLKKVLVILDKQIIPKFQDPCLLIDFLVSCYDQGSGIAVLSLRPLFILMMEHGLQVDDFYTRLYSMLHPQIFEARHASRFFYQLNIFLKSTHLPVYLISAFVKKLARLSLTAPPIGARICVRQALNLIKRHPEGCKKLLDCQLSVDENPLDSDPFDNDEPEPAKTHALESSLWELRSLGEHYLPSLQRISDVKSLSKQEKDIGELLDEDEDEVFERACSRKYHEFPVADHTKPDRIIGGFEDISSELFL